MTLPCPQTVHSCQPQEHNRVPVRRRFGVHLRQAFFHQRKGLQQDIRHLYMQVERGVSELRGTGGVLQRGALHSSRHRRRHKINRRLFKGEIEICVNPHREISSKVLFREPKSDCILEPRPTTPPTTRPSRLG